MNTTLNDLYEKILKEIDSKRLMRTTEELLNLELKQTFSCYHASAARTLEILQEMGIPNAEKISFPANGKDAYQDKQTPIGWEASVGKVVVVEANGLASGTVIADYEAHPFQLIKGSTSTPGGKVTRMRLVTEEAVMSGASARNALVMLTSQTAPHANFLTRILDLGAAGIISDYAASADDAPDGIQWTNAFTEKGSWHVGAEDRDFIAFAISPNTGRMVRNALSRGAMTVDVQCDGRRFETTVDLVTALVPGKRKEEFWIFAHLYEPLSNDNSSGVACAMEIARYIMSRGTPEYSLRLLFGLELYGFAAYAATRGGNCNMSSSVIGGIDCDAMYLRKGWYIDFNCASPALPFYGNTLIPLIADTINARPETPKVIFRNSYETMYDDDSFLGDSTTGVPTVWPIRKGPNFWHNSSQVMDYVQEKEFAIGTAISAMFVNSVINPDPALIPEALESLIAQLRNEKAYCVGSEKEHMKRRYDIICQNFRNFERAFPGIDLAEGLAALEKEYQNLTAELEDNIPHSPLRDYMEQIIPSRLTVGFPFDMTRVPYAQRKKLPASPLYSPLGAILSNMDGKRNLAEIVRMSEHEIRRLIPEKELKTLFTALLYLEKWQYISFGGFKGLSKDDIVLALRKLGVKEGDHIAVHSQLSAFGIIEGGVKTVFEALREAVGPAGTFMTPAFTFCFANIGGPNVLNLFRYYDPEDAEQIWTGSLPRYMLKQKDVIRTRHLTHSWCIYGRKAAEIADGLKFNDPPVGPQCPLMKMLNMNGKIIHLGNAVSSTTFLHCLEDEFDLPGVEDTLCMVKIKDSVMNVAVPRNLPGCREFYHGTEENIRFFKAAAEKGLEIKKEQLGTGTIRLLDMQQLYRIGKEIVKADPFVFLCDEGHDISCDELRRKYIAKKQMPEEFQL